ncbi:MAG: pantoate--beta-alanine ligase [Candidatus Cloacimonetes bacterium]|nr:pantoate--beta-alanine ligase [Candidatus Cloacimonadota bacterium]
MKPKLIKTSKEMSEIRNRISSKIAFVPTMGSLHQGHLSLVDTAIEKAEVVIVSIYVNPTQFSIDEDLTEYPRDLDKDIKLLKEHQVDYVFFPDDEQMYPQGFKTWVDVEDITQILCGKTRPTHFRGVTTIVSKLLNIINPDLIFLGEKDFQQLAVIKQMVSDLNFQTEVIGCPIVREFDGLALSSRNKYLTAEGRKRALCLYKSLLLAQNLFRGGMVNSNKIISQMSNLIVNAACVIDYIEVFDPFSFEHLPELSPGCRIALAVIVDNTRLIDNIEIR